MEQGGARSAAEATDASQIPQHTADESDTSLSNAIAHSLSTLSTGVDEHPENAQKLQPSDPNAHTEHDDEDNGLEDAIGNVFDQFDFGSTKEQGEDGYFEHADANDAAKTEVHRGSDPSAYAAETRTDEQPKSDSAAQDHDVDAADETEFDNAIAEAFNDATKKQEEDDDLNDAIGNAFADAFGDDTSEKDESEEIDLGSAIGDAFADAFKSAQEDTDIKEPEGDSSVNKNNASNNENTHETEQEQEQEKEQEREHEQVQELEHEDHGDLDDAIGNAFADAMNTAEQNQTSTKIPATSSSTANVEEDEDLNNVIGDALENMMQPETKTAASHDSQLEDAIGNALNNMFNYPESPAREEKSQTAPEKYMSVTETTSGSYLEQDDANSESSDDLDEAIGNAFKSIMPTNEQGQLPHDTVNDDELNAMISDSYKKIVADSLSVTKESSGDKFMENAITEAFQSAMQKSADMSQISKIAPSKSQDTSGVRVQDHLNDEQAMLNKQKSYNIPQIEDNVLEHFEIEAHKEEAANRSARETMLAKIRSAYGPDSHITPSGGNLMNDSALQFRINELMQNDYRMTSDSRYDSIGDLEMDEEERSKLRQEYLSSRQSSDVPRHTTIKPPALLSPENRASILRNRPSTYIPQPSKRLLNRSGPINRIEQIRFAPPGAQTLGAPPKPSAYKSVDSRTLEAEPTRKELSIAETLALHRSYMSNTPRRDYSSMESLDKALKSNSAYGPMSSQISSVIKSITSHSTSSETNVLSAIKEMTNILTADSRGRLFLHEIPSMSEIIATYKGKEERGHIIKSLILAKNYLEAKKPIAAENSKASSLIDTVLKQFKHEFEAELAPSQLTLLEKLNLTGVPKISSDVISNISRSVVSTISNYAQSTKRVIGKPKPKDVEDSKELVRLENRARKKKWREENAERNKDNDLRSRVWKKASQLFGDADSPKKKEWTEAEFKKRKEKRISRIGKSESINNSQDLKDIRMTEDVQLRKPLTDIFNLLSGFAHHEDPNVVLAATSAATASTAALYADNKNLSDYSEFESAISSILSSVIEGMQSSGNNKRIAALSQGVSSFESLQRSDTSAEGNNSYIISTFDESSAPLSIPRSSSSSMVDQEDVLDPSLSNLGVREQHEASHKRLKVNPSDERDSYTRITDNFDQIRNSLSSTVSSVWGANSSLKIPQYKKPAGAATASSPADTVENPTLTLPTTSPFISNKANFGNMENQNAAPRPNVGLRKPGSFQRPEPKTQKGKSLGFPQLLKTTLRQA